MSAREPVLDAALRISDALKADGHKPLAVAGILGSALGRVFLEMPLEERWLAVTAHLMGLAVLGIRIDGIDRVSVAAPSGAPLDDTNQP